MISNFVFLQPEWPELFEEARRAESFALPDPRACCFYARRALELLVLWMYRHDSYLQRPYDAALNNLLGTQEFQDNMPHGVYIKTRLIQKTGNRAVHELRPVTQYESLNLCQELFHVCYWFAKSYTTGESPAPDVAFDHTLLPNPALARQKSAQELQTLEAQLRKQDEELRRQQQQLASYDAEIQRLQAQIEAAKARNQAIPDSHNYSEADTRRHLIDLLLHEAGWTLEKPEDREFEVHGMSDTKSGKGYVDYVLWGDDGRPLGLVEAKRTSKDAASGRTQAALYADCLEQRFGQRPVIFYTNGYDIWLWDDRMYPPRQVQGFYTRTELQRLIQRRSTRTSPQNARIDRNICDRYYQEAAIRHLCEHVEQGFRKGLIVMATGAGKTRVAIAVCDLLIRCNWLKKVLFLADRRALVLQAVAAFKKFLPSANPLNLLDDKHARESRVVVSTYHTIMNLLEQENAQGQMLFSPGHFDLIVIDEAHRSVYQKFGAIFTYFDSLLLGLTATPKNEIDRNTYRLFELDPGLPTYSYDLDTAIADGYLVPPKAISVPLKFQREGITYAELSEQEREQWDLLEWEDERPPDAVEADALNSWLFNEDTVDKVLEHLMQHGLKVKGGDRLGKTIIFAKNHKHAEFIEQRFNAHYPHLAGHFARVIDHYDPRAHELLIDFSQPEKAPHIAISVDMLDTGVDIEEVVNLVFFKPVRSKTKFIQMIGRGTRLCLHLFGPGQDKVEFYIFDYCQNFEFFDQHPQGIEIAPPESLRKRLFLARLDLLRGYRERQSASEELTRLAQDLAQSLQREVAAMNPDNFLVRPHRRQQERFADEQAWNALSEQDFEDLAAHLAGLPTSLPEDDESAKRFDLLMLHLQLAFLLSTPILVRLRRQVMHIARNLAQKQTIPMVNAQLALLQAIQTEGFWQHVTPDMLDLVRCKIRDLTRFVDPVHRKIMYTDFEDQLGETQVMDLPGLSYGIDLRQYRQRVEQFVHDHQDFIVIHKIKHAIPLTATDLAQLEAFFFEAEEIGGRENFHKAYSQEDGLAAFIRQIVGLDRNAAKQAFAEFLDEKTCTARQIEFVNYMIDRLTHNGFMPPDQLYQPPFIDLHYESVDGLFSETQADRLFELLGRLNNPLSSDAA